jgi:hypothetical protein
VPVEVVAEVAARLTSALERLALVEETILADTTDHGASDEEKSEESDPDVDAVLEDEAAVKAAAFLLEQSEQHLRDSRVAESFAIYKKQLQQNMHKGKITGQHPSQPAATVHELATVQSAASVSSTWDAPAPVEVKAKPLYWSEIMDIELGKLVKMCAFDFDEITLKMKDMAIGNLLFNENVRLNPSLLTNEACRLRWSQLDASQWGGISSDVTALDTVFRICINPAVLGKGHGSQPSFQALSSMSAGAVPKYLTPPSAFPSVGDLPEDDDEDVDLD